MKLAPSEIYKEIITGNLEKQSAINQLITYINNSDDVNLRVESIEVLTKIGPKNEQIFHLFENLLISDSHEEIRNSAIKAIEYNYIEKAFKPIKWALQHETSISCLITIVTTLGKIRNDKAKSYLIDKIKTMDIYEFNKSLQETLNNRKISDFTHEYLSDIYKNYIIIKYFKKNFK
ncbi:MAG: HEAT repeat domain-containing protein, partial [Promethearchaeota archaeon]